MQVHPQGVAADILPLWRYNVLEHPKKPNNYQHRTPDAPPRSHLEAIVACVGPKGSSWAIVGQSWPARA
eukprot:6324046-Pyramimonas_sp.AAC.1